MNTHFFWVESGKMEDVVCISPDPGGALLLYLFSKNVAVFCLDMRSFLLPVSSINTMTMTSHYKDPEHH